MVTVKEESKVIVCIDGKDYSYDKEEARALYEGLSEIFGKREPEQSEKLQKLVDEWRRVHEENDKNRQYEKYPAVPFPWHEVPWQKPTIWCCEQMR